MKVKDAVIIKWILPSAHLPCFLMPLSAKVHCLNKNETDLAHCNMDACQPIIFKYNFGINVAERVSYRKVSYFWNGATENSRPENAGLENDGQLRKESQGLENAGLKNDGPC